MRARKVDYTAVLIAYFSFIVLGMPGALLGIVWSPHMRETFALDLDGVAALYATVSIGYFVASFISGRLFSRYNIGLLLTGGCAIAAIAFTGYALASTWGLVVAIGFAAGFGVGILDGGMNIYFAAHFDSRLMNWLHASFGIGATLAPFIINIVLINNGSWRIGYWMIAGLYVLVAILYFVTRARWLPLDGVVDQAKARKGTPVRDTLRLPIVWVGIIFFVLFAGLESSTGQWSKTIFNESRGVPETIASNWVGLYWLSFTIGRIFFGFIVTRVEASRLIRICMFGALAGLALFVWNPFLESGLLAVALFGFMLGPIFAMMVTATQERLGGTHAANAIGFQVASSTIGIGLMPGLLGVAGVTFGLESITVALLVVLLIMTVLYELWGRMPVRIAA
ncbi:MAG: MFS transporter [Anaerolineae bacterium]|nr:MFS transporter [Anaerolineae bacterium]